MKRRNFLKGAFALQTLGFTSCSGLSLSENNSNVEASFDVIVIGGGVAGCIAAIQSARLGAKTLIIERASQLGGTMTTAGVDFPGLFHVDCKQVIAGIGWELVCKTIKENGDSLPEIKITKKHWKNQVRLNDYLYACIAEEEFIKAGGEILYYSFPKKIEETKNGYNIFVSSNFGEGCIFTKKIIDCTASASAAVLAGFEREGSDVRQPGTLIYKIKNYNEKNVNLKEVEKNYRQAIADGKLQKRDLWVSIRSLLHNGGNNSLYVRNADNSNPLVFSKTNIEGRKVLMRVFRFLKTQKGLENIKIDYIKTEVGVRETYRVVGEKKISVDEYRAGSIFTDSLCYSYYPTDLHDSKVGLETIQQKRGIAPTVPLSAMTPKGAKNMLVAGRCVSSDRLANSALRVQASCMAMGQVAGCVSAISALKNISNDKVDLNEIKKVLKANGAIVPEHDFMKIKKG